MEHQAVSRARLLWLGVPALVILLLTQAPAQTSNDDRQNIPEPAERHVGPNSDYIKSALVGPAARKLNVPRNVVNIFQSAKEAENATEFDEILDSSWFTNRNFWSPLPPDKFGEGPAQPGRAPDRGPWAVTKCKAEGIMPGFQIRDHKGDSYLLKFDPPGYLELSTAADAIASRFLYAAGYNVPENYVVTFDESILVPEKDLVCKGAQEEKRSTPAAGITQVLEALPRTEQGQLRAMASRMIEGKIKGPFSYSGVRKDDPNDRIPHEHRRELRGLRMIQSFLNNADIKQLNTLDAYVEEGGQRFLKHYLIDFGGALGSASNRPKDARDGNRYIFDPGETVKTVFTLGMSGNNKGGSQLEFPSIGYIEGDTFEPMDWRTNSPNPAFQNMTKRDGYWGAKIVAAFTNEQIEAAVRAGQYSDPNAERTLVRILEQRRDRIADYWFSRVAPLDRFRFTPQGFTFDDLSIETHRSLPDDVTYEIRAGGQGTNTVTPAGSETAVPVAVSESPLKISIKRLSANGRQLKVDVTVKMVGGKPAVVGIQR